VVQVSVDSKTVEVWSIFSELFGFLDTQYGIQYWCPILGHSEDFKISGTGCVSQLQEGFWWAHMALLTISRGALALMAVLCT